MRCPSLFVPLLALVFVFAGCGRQEPPTPVVQKKVAPANPSPFKAKPVDFQTPWQTESEYIVTMVAADLVEMTYFAKYQKRPPQALPVEVRGLRASTEAEPRYHVRAQLGEAGEITCELPITGAIWAPATYAPLVRSLFEKLPLSGESRGPEAGDDVLKQLQDLRVEVLAKVDRELSARLAREFTVAARHEEAAFLMGAFTLRQTDGLFFQLKTELCRMSAHLAFAGGLRGGREATVTGRLAESMLAALHNNQVDALNLLVAVPDDGDAGVWERTLRMRATGDFRIYGESRTKTLCEELEWFRARADSVAVDRSWASMRLSEEQKEIPDWTRVMSSRRASVQLGHIVLRAGLPAELREASVAYELEQDKPLAADGLVEALNAEPRRCVTGGPGEQAEVKIIGWGMWAACLQRQLCQVLAANFIFMRDLWGVPDDARQYQQEIDEAFWHLRLYPFVRRQCAPDYEYYKKAQDDQMAIVRRSPHIVPAWAWNHISFEVPFGPMYWPPPHPFINEWHRPNPVPGTAYNPRSRMHHRSLSERPDFVARVERMHQLAPYDQIISLNLLRIREGEKETPEAAEKVYAAGLDYQSYPLRTLARLTKDPVAKEKWIRKAAALDPSDYWTLAQFYRDQRREDDAAEAYVLWVNNEIDDVSVANSADWLIRYFERHGQMASANALADRAAATYSARGLLSKAGLKERQNDPAAALDLHQKQAERYNDEGPLLGFLVRQQERGQGDYAELRERLLKKYLPAGLVKFDRTAKEPPRFGVHVQVQNERISAAALRRGDIIVAARGYRVADWNAFKVLRSLDEEPFVMTVWRQGKYVELPPVEAGTRFGVDLLDYRTK